MSTKVQKWGNSLGLRLPKNITTDLDIKAGSEVKIESRGKGVIIIKPLNRTKKKKNKIPTLEELVSRITEDNKHPLAHWGPPVGKEVW